MADPAVSDAMTIRHLLCACTGVPRRDLEVIFNADEITAEDVVGSLSTFEVFTGFGETFQYSNQLVGTAGWAAAAAAGAEWGSLAQGYFDVIESRIFGPIGMVNSTFSVPEVLASGNYAIPHEMSADGTRVAVEVSDEAVLAPIAPAGTHWSTAEDMSRYLLTLLNSGTTPDGTRIASATNLSQAWQPQVAVTADMSYGLGWFLEDFYGQPLVHHGGNTMGFTSDLAFLPEAGLGIVVLTNGRGTNAFNEGVRNRLFELAFDLPERAGEAAELLHDYAVKEIGRIAAAGPVDPEEVMGHLGQFTNESLGTVTLSLEGEALRLDAGEFDVTIRSAEGIENFPGDYVVTDGLLLTTAVDLAHDDSGEPVIIFGKGVEEYEFTREP
jgi:CubicO group peptidase (beta-lactamase class C family)